MDSAKWQKIKDILSAVLDLPAESRADFLANETDAEIRREVEKLWLAHESAEDFIEKPFLIEKNLAVDELADELVGARIENYQILERIGAGGMGAVYLAERLNSDFKQKVALKIVKKGMDSEAILKRFASERRILSTLKHPNIAGLLDGGISSAGLPFFVMEYVDGKPLNQFCNENNLSLFERLEIFRQVCSAVDHAHKNLIIHRDLKPTNILVTDNRIPKLLDFGISKLLSNDGDEETLTATQGRVFTPEYASPEQILGKPVTTSTDVYSLGVILYELLSGHRPFETKGKSFEEIVKSLCETEPKKPSEPFTNFKDVVTQNGAKNPQSKLRNPQLKGDLDNIILKALRKEPDERYGSVQQFSEDIGRFLEGLPVLARSQTLKYRFGKYVKRHKAGVLAATLILLSLVGGISVATWQAVEARRERANAERQFAETRKIANSLLFEIHDSLSDLPGATASRELLVKRALEYLNNLSLEAGDNPELLLELSIAYRKVGDILGDPYNANTGQIAQATESYQKSLEIQEQLLLKTPNETNLHREILMTGVQLGDNLFSKGNYADSKKTFRRAIEAATVICQKEPQNTAVYNNLAFLYLRLNWFTRDDSSEAEMAENLNLAEKYTELSLAADPENEDALQNTALIYTAIGNRNGNPDYNDLGKPSEALSYLQKSLSIRQKFAEKAPSSNINQNLLGISYKDLGDVLLALGKTAEAIENYQTALKIHQNLAESDKNNALAQGTFAYDLTKLGNALLVNGETKTALEKHKESVSILEKLNQLDETNMQLAYTFALSLAGLADSLAATKQQLEALAGYQRGLKIIEEINFKQPDVEMQRKIAQLSFKVGKTIEQISASSNKTQTRCQDSVAAYQKSVDFFQQASLKSTLSPTNSKIFEEAQKKLKSLGC